MSDLSPEPASVAQSAARPPAPGARHLPTLFLQQLWVVKLRWLAGTCVTLGGLLDHFRLRWYANDTAIITVGAAILLYNVAFWALSRARRNKLWTTFQLQALIWMQILLDLICLTLLTCWTGGYSSPLRGFFVFHMVFASLLLPRTMAFGVAFVAIGMVEGALLILDNRTRSSAEIASTLGWDLTLLATVYLASRITRSLRRQRRRLIRQNRRIRAMSLRLRRQQQALIQQEKMVAMGQMAAGVAHEVANPLASMDGLLQLLERRPDKISPENMARLREQISRINQIVRQLTTFAHPQEGAWQISGLNDVVTRALDVLHFDPRFKKITIDKDLAPDLPPIRMLPSAIEQVLINMAINAADAMDSVASPRLLIRTRLVEDAHGRNALLEIKDNGQGIAPHVRDRIFEPFFTTKPVGKGTGLGLSISYSLVRKHGGEISLTSSPGKGTSFTIQLPLEDPSRPREPATAGIVTPEKSSLQGPVSPS